jgi:predicted alpha/beta superfamily hydrolase
MCLSNLIYGQDTNLQSKTYKHLLVSEQNIEYKIIVTLPPNYDNSKTYQTLYYLDAWWLEDIIKGNYNILNRVKAVEQIVLVGISIDGTPDQFTKQRTRDYTPTPYDMKFPFILPLEFGSFFVDSTNSGRSNLFKFFLKDKVFPFVSKKYSVDNNNKGFLGHSFGGLFGVYDAFDSTPLFDKHIIIAPALWWNKSLALYENMNHRFREINTKPNLFICYGETESITIVQTTDRLIKYFEDANFERLTYYFKVYENQDHVSLLPKSIYDGIKYFYKK